MFLRRRRCLESKCEMSFSLIFRLHLALFSISPSIIFLPHLCCSLHLFMLQFISFQLHSSCFLFCCFCPGLFCRHRSFYICFRLFSLLLTLLRCPILTSLAVVLLIRCLVMQQDTNFPFEKRARPIAPCVDVVYHILGVCATLSAGFHHSPPAIGVYRTQKKPCGTRALYQHPCCFVVFSTFFLPVLSGRSQSLKMSERRLRDNYRVINRAVLQTSSFPSSRPRLLGFFYPHMHFLEGRCSQGSFSP